MINNKILDAINKMSKLNDKKLNLICTAVDSLLVSQLLEEANSNYEVFEKIIDRVS